MTNKSVGSKKAKTTKTIPDNVDPETGEVMPAPLPDYKKATHDFLDEFTSDDWDSLTKEQRFCLYEHDDGEVARKARAHLRAVAARKKIKQPEAAQGEVMVRESAEQPAGPAQLPATQNNGGRESALSIVGGVSTEQLKAALVVQTEQRQLIQQFIQDNLVEGVDYGKIHVVKNCVDEDRKRGSCTKDYHYSKSILFKPGQEKIFSLFGITDELEKDDNAYEMLPGVQGMVAFKCLMYRGENKVGEGRGAATLSGSNGDPNAVIKKAEKRARMDACLSLGFSAYFTQDLDDPEYKSQREMMNEKARNEAEARDRDENGLLPRNEAAPIDDAERKVLARLILAAGIDDKTQMLELLRANGVADPAAMTSGEARKMIKKLKAADFLAPEQPAGSAPADDDGPLKMPEKPKEPLQPAELVIDDDLKQFVQENYSQIGLNSQGRMWFLKYVTGKPFGDFSRFTDKEWRRAYDFVDDILNVRIPVEPRHMSDSTAADQAVMDYTKPTNDPPDLGPVGEIFPGAQALDDSKERPQTEEGR